MREPQKTIWCTVLLSTLALAGCGSDAPAKAKAVPRIPFKSAAVVREALPARYTCDGRDVSPPLEWGAVPADVGDLALFVVGFTPDPATKSYKISVEWAVAGLNPALHKLSAGQLPLGTFLGVASDDKRQSYSICPKRGTTVHYQFELYGLSEAVGISPDFAGLPVLKSLASNTGASGTQAHGAFIATYTRK
jgi:phosphatidylethanolamine-binding protein (PEBP) family uncharacterized protein